MDRLNLAEKQFKRALLNHIRDSFLDTLVDAEGDYNETNESYEYKPLELPSMDEMVKWYYEDYPNRYSDYEPELKDYLTRSKGHRVPILPIITLTSLLTLTLYILPKLLKRQDN